MFVDEIKHILYTVIIVYSNKNVQFKLIRCVTVRCVACHRHAELSGRPNFPLQARVCTLQALPLTRQFWLACVSVSVSKLLYFYIFFLIEDRRLTVMISVLCQFVTEPPCVCVYVCASTTCFADNIALIRLCTNITHS